MGDDIKKILNTMKARLGTSTLKLAIILGVNAGLIAIMITFEVVAINRYRYTDDDEKADKAAEDGADGGGQAPAKQA